MSSHQQSNASKPAIPSGMFIVQAGTSKTEENYIGAKQDEMFLSQGGQIFSSPAAFPVTMYSNKDATDDTIIRRTRSLIPHTVKCQIIQLAQDNPRITQGEIAQMFGIDRTTVSKILKRRHKFLEESLGDQSQSTSSVSPPKKTKSDDVINDALHKYISLWYMESVKKGKNVTQSKVIEVAQSIAKNYGIFDVTNDDWLSKFFTKNNIKESDIEDLVKKEDPSSSDEIPSFAIDEQSYLLMQDARETSPKIATFSKVKPGNRVPHISSPRQNATPTRQPSATITAATSTSSLQGNSAVVTSSRHGTGNKIPKVQTESADTTRDDLQDVKKEVDELDTSEALKREMGNLEKFREQQKMIEEANKQRKALLSKTLSERQKKAQEEARKLAHIQREVMILDNLLTADVNVIRSRIEIASRDFLDAQKRYERAEKEFIDAKIDLQKKSELKEHLTEHLYTIIHQNEIRKANKLSELMKELEMEQTSETQVIPSLPPLSSFNTMSSAHTLHSPKSPPQSSQESNSAIDHENVKQSEHVKQNDQTKTQSADNGNVKTTENVIQIDLTDSSESADQSVKVDNCKIIENKESPQKCIENNVKSVEAVDLTNEQNCSENSETSINETSDNLSENNNSSTPPEKAINSPANTVVDSPVVINPEVHEEKEESAVEIPSTWTLDVVKNNNST